MSQITFATPTGLLTVTEADDVITGIQWTDAGTEDADDAGTPLLREARRQLDRYFAGERIAFDLPLRAAGTPFQQAIWQAMQAIPYGETRTYGDLARGVDAPARAVGTACGQNPIPIVIPCHRVVGTGTRGARFSLTGFSGGAGVETKRALLMLEGLMLV